MKREIMKVFKIALGVLAIFILAGCSSQKDFVRPSKDAFTLGKSSHDDVIKAMGNPTFEGKEVDFNGEKVKSSTFFYTESPAFWGMIIEKHSLNYTTLSNVVVSEEYNSSYDKDKTKFDLDKIPLIKKGMSELDVLTLMGTPSGRCIYPVIKDKTGHGLIYGYNYARFAGMLTSNNDYMLAVTIDSNGAVSDVLYKVDGKVKEIK
jgi:outer membrane protein assembly factor BamE (lipoprotein component of BamABCDE complex)